MGLTSLLPGFRELRTPLAAGYLWLVFLLNAFGGLTGQMQNLFDPVIESLELDEGAIRTLQFAALTFLAYLIGAIWDGLWPVVLRFFYTHLVWSRGGHGDRVLKRPWFDNQSMVELVTMSRFVLKPEQSPSREFGRSSFGASG